MVETDLAGKIAVVTGATHGIGATAQNTVIHRAIRSDAASRLEETCP
jgi:NADP-dependent 3-hydroxy acid dehydrogenase YdfG